MSKLDTIVNKINLGLKAGNFKSNRFQRGKFYGIAELLKLEAGKIPCEVTNKGEGNRVSIDDNYPFQLYHRIISIEAEESESSFGDNLDVTETANMRMVIVFNREIIQLKKEDIVSGVFSSLIVGISKADLTSLNIYDCDISYGQFDLDSESVYSDEYDLGDFELTPQTVMIALPYQIQTMYRKGCIQICN